MKNPLPLTKRLGLCWRILRSEPGQLLAHTERELLPAGDDTMQAMMNDSLREMVLVFGTQGHSGFSASYARQSLALLLAFNPLRPLTGDDDEWFVHDMDGCYAQNIRCGHVFKRKDGTAHDIYGKVFREPSGVRFTSKDSVVEVTFPYTPTTVYVDVDDSGQEITQ